MPAPLKHGSPSTYANHRCRCDACKRAWADYFREGGQGLRSAKRYKQSEKGKATHRRSTRKSSRASRGIKITDEECIALLQAQGNQCPICGEPLEYPGSKRATHLDHDHDTGRVRGFLCLRCNVGLGLFKDNAEFLSKAIIYLTCQRDGPIIRPENAGGRDRREARG